MKRYFGLLVSEWVTAVMIVAVSAAVLYGFQVGRERDASVAQAEAALGELLILAEAAQAADELLQCDETILPAAMLQTTFLPLTVGAVPLDPADPGKGYAPALVVEVEKSVAQGDRWDTAKRWLKALKKARGEEDGAAAEGDPTDPGEAVVESASTGLGDPTGSLRVSWNWKTLLRYEVLALEAPVCEAPWSSTLPEIPG
ncbi:MAG: hypothetical protein ACPF9T_07735 [Pseudomonadales bacterium]